jgi:hypothetical protein
MHLAYSKKEVDRQSVRVRVVRYIRITARKLWSTGETIKGSLAPTATAPIL